MYEEVFEDQLRMLTEFAGSVSEFVSLIEDSFHHHYGTWLVEPMENGKTVYRIITGGWSDNEELVAALEGTLFHLLCWEQSTRGGAHCYVVDKQHETLTGTSWGRKLAPQIETSGHQHLPGGGTTWVEHKDTPEGFLSRHVVATAWSPTK